MGVAIRVNNKIGIYTNGQKYMGYVYTCWLWKFLLYPELDFVDTSMLLVLLFIFLVLQYSSHVYSFDRSYCASKTKPSVYKDGEMVIAAFFPLFTFVLDFLTEDPRNMTYYNQ